ncbi:Transglycosylase-associated protein [Hyphomicrobium denitrificans ATCC 51888]|uniref:Transglycosylase-associated protein n=1 Tax=Hyphomicrobium denitrificans (strain ATCC 51888 / DSM 1869 / NCIMB 11706 / TK 0415) TaxID=582899 RepID=D8JUZ3_HYPDA|nr:Transglycosylase-associated protein [Hyphomicrobium denitrificans ATCC 51888]
MDIDLQSLIIWLLIGAIAGWLAGQIMKGGGFGLVGDIIVGIVGAFIAGILFPRLGFAFGNPLVGSIIAAVVGACLLLFILRLVRRGP